MEATPARPAMLKGLSNFLLEHEPHGSGFDVAHPAGVGSGRVAITCRGCGASHEYATATIELEREMTVEAGYASGPRWSPQPEAEAKPVVPASAAPVVPPREDAAGGGPKAEDAVPDAPAKASPFPRAVQAGPAAAASSRRLRGKASAEADEKESATKAAGDRAKSQETSLRPKQQGKRRRFRPVVLLIPLAILALTFAIVRLIGDAGDKGSSPAPPPAVAAPSTPAPAPQPPEPKAAATSPLDAGTYVIAVPDDWARAPSKQGLKLAPKSSDAASLEVFSDPNPGTTLEELATATAPLVQSRAGAAPGAPTSASLDGQKAFEVSTATAAETVTGIGAIAHGNRYLLISDVRKPASEAVRRQLGAMLASIKLK